MDTSRLQAILDQSGQFLTRLAPASGLLVRVSLGLTFAQTGWGKLQNLERTTGYFESLGIPLPGFHSVLVGNVELIGGSLLVLGLLTRLVAFPLMMTMLVAIVTALLPEVEGVLDLLALSETLYLGLLFLLVTHGPGAWSLDGTLLSRLKFLSGPAPGEKQIHPASPS